MAYAIVQTIENGKPYLTVVPTNWIVENGFTNFINGCVDGIAAKSDGLDALYWPPEKVNDLLKQPESTPQPTWKIMKCKIKRTNLDWKVANETQEQMMAISETEEDVGPGIKKKRIIDRMRHSGLTTGTFKSQLRNIKESASSLNIEKKPKLLNKSQRRPFKKYATIHKSSSISSEAAQGRDLITNMTELNNGTIAPIATDTTSTDLLLKNILDTVTLLRVDFSKRLSVMEMRMTSIESKLTAIPSLMTEAAKPLLEESGKIQIALEQFSFPKDVPIIVQSANDESFTPTDLLGFSVLDSISSLEKFESDLNDSNYYKMLFNKLKCFNGQCSGSGRTVCYDVLDRMFKRSLLADCSWTGIGRQITKIKFESNHNTIKLFCDVVLAADPTFSVSQCHDFLKKQLRNSTARLKSKLLRRSTQRARGTSTTMMVDEIESGDMFSGGNTIIITCPSEMTTTDLDGELILPN